MVRAAPSAEPSIVTEGTITVRFWHPVLVGVVAVGLAGCTHSVTTAPSAGQPPSATTPSSAGQPPTAAGANRSTEAPPTPLPTGAKADVGAAAAQFDSAYFAGRFATAWSLLAPTVQSQVPENVWVGVHDGCPAATPGVTAAIKAVTVFGDTAIVTETVHAAQSGPHTTEYVFYYANGHWGYSPVNPGIYHRGSITADISAAKKAGLCSSWKTF